MRPVRREFCPVDDISLIKLGLAPNGFQVSSKPIPIRMSTSLLKDLKATATALEMTDQDAMRFCIRLGLKIIASAEFDPVQPVVEKALGHSGKSAVQLIQEVREQA